MLARLKGTAYPSSLPELECAFVREVVRLGGRAERRAYLARALTSDFVEFSARPRKLSPANVRAFRRQQREHVRPPDRDCSCCGGEAEEEEGAGEGAAEARTPPIADLEEAERAIQAVRPGRLLDVLAALEAETQLALDGRLAGTEARPAPEVLDQLRTVRREALEVLAELARKPQL